MNVLQPERLCENVEERQRDWSREYTIKPFQSPWEFESFLPLYQNLKPMCVVEIGTYLGGTLTQWIEHAPPGSTIISIDLYHDPENIKKWYSIRKDINLITLTMDSVKAIETVKQIMPVVDFLFIDGDHNYAPAKIDFELYTPLVRDGGLIVIHDIYPVEADGPWKTEMWMLWRDIRRTGYITQEFSAHKSLYGIGVIFV